jgi:hypothetical protein
MDETKASVKGKHGAYYEHIAWPIFFYFFWGSNSIAPFYAKNTLLINDC